VNLKLVLVGAKFWRKHEIGKRIFGRRKKAAPKPSTIDLEKVIMDALKKFLVAKAKGSLKSTTMGVAGLIIAAGAWIQANPEILNDLIAERYAGVAISVVGLVVAIARMRTAGK
jgi:hypothetical protein